ncbi:bifunctional epoxide hydrolase 2 isoform X2 [Strigops habroptila]|uniref:bifunctional epoxide hydrolase 2 isoform X2 n=1 Tax=Strigops habroptila TaxID=2489341 RepID=UPI0011CF15B5|nr:bifunctional epoxide hydrolase 2 isoform X2 [Strigops habroptila]
MARRAVLFDLGGVLFGPGLQPFLGSCERDCALPRNFLWKVMSAGGSNSPYAKVMRGQITLSQLFSEMEEGCRQHATASGVTLPPTFSVAQAFEEMAAKGTVNAPLLQAAKVLRRNGFKTCVLTNNWVDDSAGRLFTATLMNLLHRHFDLVIESCRLGMQKPDPKIYTYALDALQAKPQEVILLDDIGENLKPAQEMGMATVLVRDTETVLKELEELSGIQLLTQQEPLPTACDPTNVTHGYVPIRIPALVDAGFRVIALEMKGYGESTAPPDIKEYSQEQICKDLVVFLDKLGIPQTVLIGHDWGGALVWNMALFYPERVRAVASLNTPYRPADPSVDIVERMKSIPTFDYQFYFQEPGVAEAELEKDIGRTLKALIRSTRQEDRLPVTSEFHRVQERGGLLVGLPENPPASQILHGPELQYYIQRFQKSGFSGPLNWYRNMRPNWHWALSAKDRKITMPALMVTAGKDKVLHPNMSKGMEEWIPQLRREHIEECGHWTQMERPAVLNRILVEWLEGLPPDPPLPKISRL